MKPETRFIVPKELYVERHVRREGIPVVYTVWKKNSSRGFVTPKEVLKHVKWPAKTPTGDALREWLNQFKEPVEQVGPDMERVKSEGFGPEAHDDDPVANTKMVT